MDGRTWLSEELATGLWTGLYRVPYVKDGVEEQKGSERAFLSTSSFLPRQRVAKRSVGEGKSLFCNSRFS